MPTVLFCVYHTLEGKKSVRVRKDSGGPRNADHTKGRRVVGGEGGKGRGEKGREEKRKSKEKKCRY